MPRRFVHVLSPALGLCASCSAACFIAVALPRATQAAGSKQLQRVRGTIGYSTVKDTSDFKSVFGKFDLPDDDYAVTRAKSAAQIAMPDSSLISLGENTTIQVGAFDNTTASPGATITVNDGSRLRFEIKRPEGGAANYHFVTATSQVAVRGTVGLLAFVNGVTTVGCVACAADSVTVTVGTQTIALVTGQFVAVSALGAVTTGALSVVTGAFAGRRRTSSAVAGAAAWRRRRRCSGGDRSGCGRSSSSCRRRHRGLEPRLAYAAADANQPEHSGSDADAERPADRNGEPHRFDARLPRRRPRPAASVAAPTPITTECAREVRTLNKSAAVALAFVLLAGCGGGGGGSSSVPAGSHTSTQSKAATGSVVISIPVASTTTQSLSRTVRYPQFVSPGASSVELSINGGPDTNFDVSATSSLCTTVAGSAQTARSRSARRPVRATRSRS